MSVKCLCILPAYRTYTLCKYTRLRNVSISRYNSSSDTVIKIEKMFKPKLFTYLCYKYFSKQTFNSYLYFTRYAQLLYTKMSSTIL